MDAVIVKLLLVFAGAFVLGFVLGYQFCLYDQGGVVE